MFDLQSLGRLLLLIGGTLALVGLLFLLGGRFLPWLGRLPGDIRYQGQHISCLFPIVTSIVLSIILTVILNLVVRILK